MYVNYKRANLAVVNTVSGATFTFMPGINNIDGKLWNALLENKHFKADVDAKIYVVETEDDQDDDHDDIPIQNQPAPLAKVQEDSTFRLINETFDIKTLKEMRRNETRRPVLDRIEAQIQRVQDERRNNRGRVNTDEDNG